MPKDLNEITLQTGSLLSSDTRVEAPFIMVKIGDFTFGVYQGNQKGLTHNGIYKSSGEIFPNYVKSMEVKKINGAVNQYKLSLSYPVTADDDPNFFEKIFSSISDSRKITIEYGDFNLLNYIYKDEEAIITKVDSGFDIRSSIITYTIEAVSATKLTLSSVYTFPSFTGKPSDKIKQILKNNARYHLLEVFTGMSNGNIDALISSNDKGNVTVPTMTNISALDYISKLVSYMNPVGTPDDEIKQGSIFVVNTFEDNPRGPYLKVQEVSQNPSAVNTLSTYIVDIGYPTANVVTEFSIETPYNWSIYYDYNMENNGSNYVKRINDNGEEIKIYSPLLTGTKYNIDEADKTWWTKVTEFPISARLKLKGLLKPAILMSYVKLNVWFYGRKHMSSGYYIITSHTDSISESGFFTTLTLTRVAGDEGNGY